MLELLLLTLPAVIVMAGSKKKKRATKYSLTSYEPVLHYERDFDPEKASVEVQFKRYFENDGMQQNEVQKVRQNQQSCVEEFFYTHDNFLNLLEDLEGFEETDLVSEFGKVHEFTTRRIWQRLVENNDYGDDRDGFDQAVTDMIAELVPDLLINTIISKIKDGHYNYGLLVVSRGHVTEDS